MGRHYFIRQLRDIKISIRVETFRRAEMDIYADWCGRPSLSPMPDPGTPPCSAGTWASAMPSNKR